MRRVKDIVIIGNGPAGNTAASTIRKYARSIPIHLLSQEECPEYSPCFLPDYISGSIDRKGLFLKTMGDYEQEKIDTGFGKTVYRIDPDTKCIFYEGGKKHYDKLILATGTKAIIPGIEGATLTGVFTIKTLKDAENISAYPGNTVLVVGAGPIGVEVSIALKMKGLKVYLVEKEKWILPRIIEEDLGEILQKEIKSNDIDLLTGVEIVKILGGRKVKSVLLSNKTTIDCDMIIFSAGMKPNTDIAQNAGVRLGNLGGIITDDRMMTNIPDIYACGDCIELIDSLTDKNIVSALWPNAVIGGRITALNAIGISRRMPEQINLNRIKICGLNFFAMGYSSYSLEGIAKKDIIKSSVYGGEYRIILADGHLVGMQIIGTKNMVSLFNLIYKKENLSRIINAIRSNELIRENPMFILFFRSLENNIKSLAR